MKNVGLVCEGGGLRGIYTAGVLDYFIDQDLYFSSLVGVSAGALFPAAYISKQKKRSLMIKKKYMNDKRYMSLKNLIIKGSLFDPDFAHFKMAKELIPLDYSIFKNSKIDFKIGAFNCLTGKTDFFSKDNLSSFDEVITALIASTSLPFLSKKVKINNQIYLDGGIADPIPINESVKIGNKKHLIILTQGKGYIKKTLKYKPLINLFYFKHPRVTKVLINRHEIYNKTMETIEKIENAGEAYILRPSEHIEVKRLEKNISKIEKLYKLGYEDAKNNSNEILSWLKN